MLSNSKKAIIMERINIEAIESLKLSEIDIINRINAGEKELYEILSRRNNQKLYRVIRSYIKDIQEIEDIMQNTYLKAYEKLYQFKNTSKFSTWLIRIGINETLARLREKAKIYTINKHPNYSQAKSILEIPDESQLNPESKIIGEEAKRLLEYVIDSLDTKYRSVYVMKEIEEMSIKDISECLDLSDSNVKVRLHRAKSMLKEKLNSVTIEQEIFEYGNSRCANITDRVMQQILS